jgi:hypothetical protein
MIDVATPSGQATIVEDDLPIMEVAMETRIDQVLAGRSLPTLPRGSGL